MKLHRKIEHYDKVCHLQELGSYAQGQGYNHVRGQIVPETVFKVTAREQGHYKGPSGAFVTYCNISCFYISFFMFAITNNVRPFVSICSNDLAILPYALAILLRNF